MHQKISTIFTLDGLEAVRVVYGVRVGLSKLLPSVRKVGMNKLLCRGRKAPLMIRSLSIPALSILALSLAGCGAGIYPSSTPPQQTGPLPVATQQGSVSISPQYSALGTGQRSTFTATVTGGGQVMWLVNGVAGGNSTVGTIDAQGNYTSPAKLTQSVNTVITAELSSSPQNNYATAVVSVMAPSVVTATNNPQVANYAADLPEPGQVTVEFGDSSSYGFPTSSQACPASAVACNTLVAGMRAATLYHMRCRISFDDGASYIDSDHTFTTGQAPETAKVQATAGANGTPQPGIEIFDTLRPHQAAQAFATDLSGNVIWTYSDNGPVSDLVQPIKLLPNGHFLVQVAYASSIPVTPGATIPQGILDEVREVDLAGNTIRSVTAAQIAMALQQQGYQLQVGSLHHDVLSLPNGHMVLLLSITKSFTGLPGYPGTENVLGDLLVDVDQNFKPDWVWNSFDHLDVNRHPYLFPDWTHSNALLYSADDHNLLLSIRHQNWIVKIAFDDGAGAGNILWRLGQGGDFQLVGGTDPTDWFYAEHGPNYFSANTSGVFGLGVMDNGDDRLLPDGQVNCPTDGPADCYSTAEVFQVNESSMKATLLDRYEAPADPTKGTGTGYSFFGGNVDTLPNGDMEVNFCAAPGGSLVQELAGAYGSQTVVWQAVTPGANQFRAERLGSLYPGVQW